MFHRVRNTPLVLVILLLTLTNFLLQFSPTTYKHSVALTMIFLHDTRATSICITCYSRYSNLLQFMLLVSHALVFDLMTSSPHFFGLHVDKSSLICNSLCYWPQICSEPSLRKLIENILKLLHRQQ